MKIKYLGHSSFMITTDDCIIITDPFIRHNALASTIDVAALQCDYLLLSHAHSDHVADVEEIAMNCGATVIANYEIVQYYSKKKINGIAMNIGGTVSIKSCKIKMVGAVHSSSFEDGSYGGLACGYVISDDKHNIYFAGDTALHKDMTLLKEWYGKMDCAILPIGDVFTMGIEDALMASNFINSERIIGCHYNTFAPITIDTDKAAFTFKEAGKELIIMSIGQQIDI